MAESPIVQPTRFGHQRTLHPLWPLLAAIIASCATMAQTPLPADSQPTSELPANVQAALADIEDFSFSFVQPGFYALLEHLKTTHRPPGLLRPPLPIDDWTTLLERPADFRGLPLTIEGTVGRNKPWRFQQEPHRRLGTLWQLELARADQPLSATVILTNDASDIPLDATIRVTGYFVMIRQYYSRTNRIRQAALLVADGPTVVSTAVARTAGRSGLNLLIGALVALTAALLVIWILLRRSVVHPRQSASALHASTRAPTSLADDLAAWAAEDSDQAPGDSAAPGPPPPPTTTGDANSADPAERP